MSQNQHAPGELLMTRTVFRMLQAMVITTIIANGTAAEESERSKADLLLTGLTLIDIETGRSTPGQSVVIDDGRIVALGEDGAISTIYRGEVREHQGDFALPGLWDMHIHLRGGSELAQENAAMLDRYLPYGITGVRDAAGDNPDDVITWRNEIETGQRLGPAVFTALRKLDGKGDTWAGSIAIENSRSIAPALTKLVAQGADFIKLYDYSLGNELFVEILEMAQARGLKTSAHIPITLPFERALTAGLDSVEHPMYLLKAAAPDDAAISAALAAEEDYRFYTAIHRFRANYDADYARKMFDRMASKGMAATSTLYIMEVLANLHDNRHLNDTELAFIPRGIQDTYDMRVNGAAKRTAKDIENGYALAQSEGAILLEAHRAGVMVLAGSDSGPFNSYVYPGDSLHRELEVMVQTGFTPLETLRAATINGAMWLGLEHQYGSIKVGKVADLLILSDNPLHDIRHTRKQTAVVRAGRYLDAQWLRQAREKRPEMD